MCTARWGNEVSWKIVDKDGMTVCASREAGSYKNHRNHHAEKCTIAPTSLSNFEPYKLVCEDTYGDGWNGGHLTMQGNNYCEDFTSGKIKEVNLEIRGNCS